MDNKFGTVVHLDPPGIDFDLDTNIYQIIHKIAIESAENFDDAAFAEICKIAREKGVATLVVLDKKKIAEALEKATPKKVKRTNRLIKSSSPGISDRYQESLACPTCLVPTSMVYKYCDQCGQKLDWEDN